MEAATTATAPSTPATTPAPAPAAVAYRIDSTHAAAHFKVRHLMVSHVRGELGEITGEALLFPEEPARSRVSASIDASALSTRNADRDAHLRGPDFLDVATHPKVTFRSTAIRPTGPGEYEVDGELGIRGVTRPVTLTAEVSDEIRDPWGNARRGVTATGRFDRKAYGLTWNAAMEGGGLVVGDTVEVTIEAELVRS